MHMKNIIILFCLLVGLSVGDTLYAKPPIFMDNYTEALKVSKDLNQPLILIFSADWCIYCKKLQKDISDRLDKFQDTTICMIDIDRNREMSKKYKVKTIPKTIVFDSSQKKIKEINGYFDVDILGKSHE